jgi:hypothetical protein
MRDYWVHLKVRNNGDIEECAYYSPAKAVEKLMGRKVFVQKDDFFKIFPHDKDDILAVKTSVEKLGGPAQLAYKLGVNRGTIYQWIYRKRISGNYRQTVYDLAGKYTPEVKAKYFTEDEWEKILDE